MRAIYRQTRILLVPSQWEAETWGRVVTEAQFSGIPVVASARGGLPEAVGPGGLVLGHDEPATVWAGAIGDLWSNADRYRQFSEAALKHSARPAVDPDRQLPLLLSALERFLA
jgi:glycosyltransferase involved in cell wall biosynthesis